MSERYEAVPNSLSDNGYDVRDTVAGAWVDELPELNRLAADVAALRQRAEALEKERDEALKRCTVAHANLSAEGDLKRAAYAKLDQTREVVEKTIIPALEAARAAMNHMGDALNAIDAVEEGDEEHFPAWGLVDAALAAARKTLED